MIALATDWDPLWISYEWWRDIGVPGLSGLGSLAVGVGALWVAIYAARLSREATKAQNRAVAAQVDPILRARWIALEATAKNGSIAANLPNALLLVENVGSGTAFQVQAHLGSDVWAWPEDAPTGWQSTFARRVGEPGGTILVRWVDHLGEKQEDDLPIPSADSIDFVEELP